MVGGEEIVSDPLPAEAHRTEVVPHPLTEASLKVMRTAIRPEFNGVEAMSEVLDAEEEEPDVEHELIVMLVSRRTIAEEVQVIHLLLAIRDIFEDDDTVLYIDYLFLLSSSLRRVKGEGGEVHQEEEGAWLEIRPAQLVLMALRFFIDA